MDVVQPGERRVLLSLEYSVCVCVISEILGESFSNFDLAFLICGLAQICDFNAVYFGKAFVVSD